VSFEAELSLILFQDYYTVLAWRRCIKAASVY